MGINNFSGYSVDSVYRSLGSIQTAYNKLHQSITTYVQNGFVSEMSEAWACTQAQEFFKNGFQPVFDEIIRKINENFTVITEGINGAAKMWALKTKTDYSAKTLEMINTKIDVSLIKENINGIRGIDKATALTVVNKLNSFETEAISALSDSQNAVRNCGLLGGEQENALYNLLGKNKTIISEYIEKINVEVNKAINDTIASYGDTEGRISQAFNG